MATTRYIDIKVRTSGAEKSVSNLDKEMKGLGKDTDKTTKSFGALSKVAAAVTAALSAQNIIKYADAFSSVQNQIRQTTKTTEDLTTRTAQLLDVANRSRTEFGATAELYTQLNLSTENLGLSTEKLLRLTETIGKSFAVSGKTAAESSGAIRQLGQAFGSGALRGDEFNSIAEGAPEIMRALQRSLGKTSGELRAFAATGGITAEILVNALSDAASVIDEKMTKATKTFGQAMQEANNNMTAFVGSSDAVKGVVGAAGDALVNASNNIELISKGALVLATVFAARLIPSMLTYTAGVYANTTAQLLNNTAAVRTVNIYGTVAVAQAGATVTTNALTLASRALSASMALVGGPVGIALIAAAALITFSDEIFNTGKKAELSTDQVDGFTKSISNMSRAAKGAALTQLNNEMQSVRAEIIETQRLLDGIKVQNSGGLYDKSTIDAAKYATIIKDLNDKLDLLSQKQGLIVGQVDTSGFTDSAVSEKPAADTVKVDSPFTRQLSQETKQLQIELELRRQVEAGYISQSDADKSASYLLNKDQQEARFLQEIIRLGADEEKKAELRFFFEEKQLLDKELFESSLTGVEREAANERITIAEEEANAKASFNSQLIGAATSLGTSLLKLNISNNAKSEKEKKKARIKGIAIDAAGAIIKNFATASNFYEALGQNAFVLGAAISQTAAVNSASTPGATGGGSASASSAPSAISAPINNVSTENTAITQLTNELRNRDPDEPLTVDFTRRIVAAITDKQSSGVV